jgi:translation initiation factor 3 subunit C
MLNWCCEQGQSAVNGDAGEVKNTSAFTGSTKLMEKLCSYIYLRDNTDRIRTRATLCHIYHHALHGRWFEARDLMLISHLQETIQHSDIPTQVSVVRL